MVRPLDLTLRCLFSHVPHRLSNKAQPTECVTGMRPSSTFPFVFFCGVFLGFRFRVRGILRAAFCTGWPTEV